MPGVSTDGRFVRQRVPASALLLQFVAVRAVQTRVLRLMAVHAARHIQLRLLLQLLPLGPAFFAVSIGVVLRTSLLRWDRPSPFVVCLAPAPNVAPAPLPIRPCFIRVNPRSSAAQSAFAKSRAPSFSSPRVADRLVWFTRAPFPKKHSPTGMFYSNHYQTATGL